MSGLTLSLSAHESFYINGALLENGDRPARIRIKDGDARVLRCRDALLPQAVDTPVKRLYYAVQLVITGDIEEAIALPAIFRECVALADIFKSISPSLIPTLEQMLQRANYYSALCHLRQVITLEASMLGMDEAAFGVEPERKVA